MWRGMYIAFERAQDIPHLVCGMRGRRIVHRNVLDWEAV